MSTSLHLHPCQIQAASQNSFFFVACAWQLPLTSNRNSTTCCNTLGKHCFQPRPPQNQSFESRGLTKSRNRRDKGRAEQEQWQTGGKALAPPRGFTVLPAERSSYCGQFGLSLGLRLTSKSRCKHERRLRKLASTTDAHAPPKLVFPPGPSKPKPKSNKARQRIRTKRPPS